MSTSILIITTFTTDTTEATTITTTSSTNTDIHIVMRYYWSGQLRLGMTECLGQLIQEMDVASKSVTMIDLWPALVKGAWGYN